MSVSINSSVSSPQRLQTTDGGNTRLNKTLPAATKNGRQTTEQTDSVEISPEGFAAYKEKKVSETPEYRNAIIKLTTRQNEVLAHEQAHMSVGGDVAGAASYSYTTGPDGRSYISGGEVPISIPESNDKEQMLKALERVKKAALAPAEPSSQDLSVAAEASAQATKLRAELTAEKTKEESTDAAP